MNLWNSRIRPRAEAKHLCGQVCLHKLADDFMARVIAGTVAPARRQPEVEENISLELELMDTSDLTARPQLQVGIAARLKGPLHSPPVLPMPAPRQQPEYRPQPEIRPQPALFPMPAAMAIPMPPAIRGDELAVPLDEPPRYATRHGRADAWEREREREARAAERTPENPSRRRFHA